MHLLTLSVVAFCISLAFLLALRPLAIFVGLVDRPGGRKTHHGVIPVYGGVAMFSGLVAAAVRNDSLGEHGAVLLAASALMVFLGLVDDRTNVRPSVRLVVHLAVASLLVYGTGFQVGDLGDVLGVGVMSMGWLSAPFTVVACVALVNAFNMLDGLDGLAAGVALTAFLGVIGFATVRVAPTSALIAYSMSGALLAFLFFNMPARFNRNIRVFMGDAGSTLLGFVLAGVGLTLVQGNRADVPPILVLWLMPIPIFELFSSTFRRLRNGVSPAEADAFHFHHRLVAAGFSVRSVFSIYLLVSACSAALAVWALNARLPEYVLFLGFLCFFWLWSRFVARSAWLISRLPKRYHRDSNSPF